MGKFGQKWAQRFSHFENFDETNIFSASQNALTTIPDREKCHFPIVTLEISKFCEAERIQFMRVPAKFESQVSNFSEFEINNFTIPSS